MPKHKKYKGWGGGVALSGSVQELRFKSICQFLDKTKK